MPSFKRQIERKVSAQAAIRQIKNFIIVFIGVQSLSHKVITCGFAATDAIYHHVTMRTRGYKVMKESVNRCLSFVLIFLLILVR
jgi:hypothetical protein